MALTLLREIGYDLKKLPSQWKSFSLPEGRFSRIPYKKGIEMIFDGYNASPFSFAKGIQAIDKLQTKGRKVLVFSDMLELGNESEALHRQLGDQINQSDFNLIIAYGQHSKKALESIKSDRKEIFFCLDTDEASRVLKSHIKSDDLIYFKASRGMRVEKVRDSLMKEKA
jgi:UDP-N-acetylmuramoyl-tripeptide--D-alanyl-D-alanine ligase